LVAELLVVSFLCGYRSKRTFRKKEGWKSAGVIGHFCAVIQRSSAFLNKFEDDVALWILIGLQRFGRAKETPDLNFGHYLQDSDFSWTSTARTKDTND